VLGFVSNRQLSARFPAPQRAAKEGLMARILLADDDAATRDLVTRALAGDGHTVDATQDGTEALEKLQGAPTAYDLLITDVQMPGLDGIALAEQGLAGCPQLRIILMSGFADELGRAGKLKSNVSSVLTKPFTLEQIKTAVKAALT
jgi:two-component system, cell cycle response regulator CpdR